MMKKEINSLNLLYGMATIDIFVQYNEFKHLKNDEIIKVSKNINNYFIWLETQKNINAFNVIKIGMFLIDDSSIRKNILTNDKKNLYSKTNQLLKKLDYTKLEQHLYDKNNIYIENTSKYKSRNRKYNVIEFMREELTKSELLFKDLIMLILDNYEFSEKMFESKLPKNEHLIFLNKLNYMYYHLASYLNSSREDLYYCSLFLLKYPNIDQVLYSNYYSSQFEMKNFKLNISSFVYKTVIRSLNYINSYYFIEFFDFNYNTSQNRISYSRIDKSEKDCITNMTNTLTSDDKIFLYKLAFMEDNYKLTKTELKMLDHLIESFKKLDNIYIVSQELTIEKQKLLNDTVSYIYEYTKKNNIQLLEFFYDMQFKSEPKYQIVKFYIQHNNFKYRFSIRKLNDKLIWSVYLKHKKVYKINMYLKDDFKHIYQAMLED